MSEFDIYLVFELSLIMSLVSIQCLMCTLVRLGLSSSLFHLARYYSPQLDSNRFLPVQVTKVTCHLYRVQKVFTIINPW